MRVKCSDNEGRITYSEYYGVNYGVPQGSCLGPLLFLVFCNDLSMHLSFCNSILFPDNTTLYKSHDNLRYLQWCICEELKHLTDWFHAKKLTFNLNKSCCVLFTNKSGDIHDACLNINNVMLPIVENTKFLGVWIDRNLNWNKHINSLILKIKRNMRHETLDT